MDELSVNVVNYSDVNFREDGSELAVIDDCNSCGACGD